MGKISRSAVAVALRVCIEGCSYREPGYMQYRRRPYIVAYIERQNLRCGRLPRFFDAHARKPYPPHVVAHKEGDLVLLIINEVRSNDIFESLPFRVQVGVRPGRYGGTVVAPVHLDVDLHIAHGIRAGAKPDTIGRSLHQSADRK